MDKRVVLGIVLGSLILVVVGIWLAGRKSASPTETAQLNDELKNLTAITEADWVKGKKTAQVTLIEYGDFQCPACGAYYILLKQLLDEQPEKLKIVFRQYPLNQIHDKAYLAAKASEAAGKQGKFWEMHDKLFERQKDWAEVKDFEEVVVSYAGEIGLNVTSFESDLVKPEIEKKIQNDRSTADLLGVTGTPSFFLNGIKIVKLPGSIEAFKALIEGESIKITPSESEQVHKHFDIAIYMGGKKQIYSDAMFMEKHPAIHFHDGNGEVAHIHQSGATLGMFVESLGLSLETKPIINGIAISEWREYKPQDLDRIVFGDGPVTDKACIYSGKCLERGKPPTEKCVGGLGTECE